MTKPLGSENFSFSYENLNDYIKERRQRDRNERLYQKGKNKKIICQDCGIEVYASNRLVARHYVKTPDRFLNNFNVAYFVAGTTMTGNIEIRPVGTLKYKVGYEPIVCYNLFIYTVPLTIYNNTGRLIALEGDI